MVTTPILIRIDYSLDVGEIVVRVDISLEGFKGYLS